MTIRNSVLLGCLLLAGCSSYKSSWDCPKELGIGCSSLEYADEVARDQIILNSKKESSKRILFNEDLLGDQHIREVYLYE